MAWSDAKGANTSSKYTNSAEPYTSDGSGGISPTSLTSTSTNEINSLKCPPEKLRGAVSAECSSSDKTRTDTDASGTRSNIATVHTSALNTGMENNDNICADTSPSPHAGDGVIGECLETVSAHSLVHNVLINNNVCVRVDSNDANAHNVETGPATKDTIPFPVGRMEVNTKCIVCGDDVCAHCGDKKSDHQENNSASDRDGDETAPHTNTQSHCRTREDYACDAEVTATECTDSVPSYVTHSVDGLCAICGSSRDLKKTCDGHRIDHNGGERERCATMFNATPLARVISGEGWALDSSETSRTSRTSKGKGTMFSMPCTQHVREVASDTFDVGIGMGMDTHADADEGAPTPTHTHAHTHTHTQSPPKVRSSSRVSFRIPTAAAARASANAITNAEASSTMEEEDILSISSDQLADTHPPAIHRDARGCHSSTSNPTTPTGAGVRNARESADSSGNVSSAYGKANLTSVLTEGHDRMNTTTERGRRMQEGKTLARFAAKSFWIVLLVVAVVTVPFAAVLIAYLMEDRLYLCECNPVLALSITMVCVSGVLHCGIIWLYAWQVMKHRNHPAIKPRGQHFLLQLCVVGCIVPVMGTLNSLEYLGVLQGICIFSYIGEPCAHSPTQAQARADQTYFVTTWSEAQGLVLQLVHIAMRFTTTMYFAAVIARQRILYILFVGDRRTRTYSRRQMFWQYLYPNLILLVCWAITETMLLVFVISAFHSDVSRETHLDLTVGLCFQIALVLGMLAAFCYYAHMTRYVELVFSDYWANLRMISIFTFVSVAISVARLVSATSLVVGLMYGPLEMAFVTLYFMDSFTAALINIHHGIDRVSLPSAPSFVSQALRRWSTAPTQKQNLVSKSHSLDKDDTQGSQSVPTEL
ncbi:hypothetical protein SARC_02743 [Sphaeroforma arctica JP610]|uniref:Uncharacterized protein n=1 Tax=Sphaeroforma arctica JP610 TaxID=667725 RepID=A0A0L0G7S7_9EUKA|nr:hypothetical protein SARC_02743 [Sphaeroforma arctica JP610]KNC85050.1 hypothetical protein SARC_02743 [Sphaeroforma arctica JP610]|eukprot:XP_014158952.1 hypothetical protein SARC_02743 [Sphaeroforma arctica JP610]